jgi:hypothetical protein
MVGEEQSEVVGCSYQTYILRCWVGEGRQIRARLIAVSTGVSHPVGNLAELPETLKQLILTEPSNTSTPEHAGERPTVGGSS